MEAIEIDGNMRFRLRMCKWKQWKKNVTRCKALKKLGFNEDTSKKWANSRKSYAKCASSFLQGAIPNELIKKRGLVTILDQYQLKHI